ncbi:MAG TPA: YccF domain-containing protein [Terriglobia bacterium]|nr:YccF domain-containing protein [Terriglobia bacterium]
MTLIGNVLRFVFGGGIFAWLLWMLSGVLLAMTIVGMPFAVAAFRIAGFAAFPFGRQLIDARNIGRSRSPALQPH